MLAVMMLRGPQTPGELLQRTERLHRFPDSSSLHAVIDRLMERELVARYDRRPGQREDRYGQLLGAEADEEPAAAPATPGAAAAAAAPRRRPARPARARGRRAAGRGGGAARGARGVDECGLSNRAGTDARRDRR